MIVVQMYLDRWRQDLQRTLDDERAIRQQVAGGARDLGNRYGRESPEGIISRNAVYESCAPAFQRIIAAGAQWYFEAKITAWLLSPENSGAEAVSYSLMESVFERTRVALAHLDEMAKVVEDMIPRWYAESPARLSTSDFFWKHERRRR